MILQVFQVNFHLRLEEFYEYRKSEILTCTYIFGTIKCQDFYVFSNLCFVSNPWSISAQEFSHQNEGT